MDSETNYENSPKKKSYTEDTREVNLRASVATCYI